MFPQASLGAHSYIWTDDRVRQIRQDSGVNVLNREMKVCLVAGGGWFILDQVLGKHQLITYASRTG